MKRPAPLTQLATSTIVRLFGVALIVAIVAGALISIIALRNKEIEDWRRNLGGMSFMVAENTSQTVFSAYLVLDSITERVRQSGVGSDAEFRARLSTPEIHQMLRERIQGLPQVDVASLVAANGDNINFSRSYPVPPINLAERDYFKAHQNNPNLGDFISTAVRNKGNGKWTFYVSRRLNDARGRFMGLVLVGLSVDALTQVYDRVTTGLGDGASITLYRSDLTSLARSPRKDEVIGKVNETGSTHWVIDLNKKNEAVVMVDTPRFSTGQKETPTQRGAAGRALSLDHVAGGARGHFPCGLAAFGPADRRLGPAQHRIHPGGYHGADPQHGAARTDRA